jgi:hypothetical protein
MGTLYWMHVQTQLCHNIHKNKTIQYALYLLFFFSYMLWIILFDYIILLSRFICCHWKQDTPNQYNGMSVNIQVKYLSASVKHLKLTLLAVLCVPVILI